jgi:hypothetical protein
VAYEPITRRIAGARAPLSPRTHFWKERSDAQTRDDRDRTPVASAVVYPAQAATPLTLVTTKTELSNGFYPVSAQDRCPAHTVVYGGGADLTGLSPLVTDIFLRSASPYVTSDGTSTGFTADYKGANTVACPVGTRVFGGGGIIGGQVPGDAHLLQFATIRTTRRQSITAWAHPTKPWFASASTFCAT